jgi:hypothetical protein
MDWPFIVAVAIAVPIILFPAAFIRYLNLGGLVRVMRAIRARDLGTKAPAAAAKRTRDCQIAARQTRRRLSKY